MFCVFITYKKVVVSFIFEKVSFIIFINLSSYTIKNFSWLCLILGNFFKRIHKKLFGNNKLLYFEVMGYNMSSYKFTWLVNKWRFHYFNIIYVLVYICFVLCRNKKDDRGRRYIYILYVFDGRTMIPFVVLFLVVNDIY